MKRLSALVVVLVVSALLVAGLHCSAGVDEPPRQQKRGEGAGSGLGRHAQPVRAAGAARAPWRLLAAGGLGVDSIAGFRQTRATSHKMAEVEKTEQTPFGVRLVGPSQAFVAWANGYSETSPHANAALRAGPFYRSPEAHEVRVRGYFAGAGLPTEQVGRASVTVGVDMTGPMDRSSDKRSSQGVTTVLHRSVDGVEVSDSFAWARLNTNDVVVAERIWWPELPGDIRARIAEFKGALTGNFRTLLPATFAGRDGVVRVHHALPLGHRWYAAVTWDVLDQTTVRHFDITGQEVTMTSWDDPVGDARP